MGFKCGIVGLPNVGKSTLFNALTKAGIEAANYPFCTIEPNIGRVLMPDERLEKIAAITKSAKIIPTTMEFVDIAGLVAGASKGEGLGNKFLATIRETEAIAHVVRCFADDDILHVAGKVDPIADIETIATELCLADLESVERAWLKIVKSAKGGDKEALATTAALGIAKQWLNEAKPVRLLPAETQFYLRPLKLLTAKPVLYIANVHENGFHDNPYLTAVAELAHAEQASVVPVCAAIESDIAELAEDENKEFLTDLGLAESGLNRLIRAGYALLKLQTYFTTGPQETRAWTIAVGATAPQAAGVIHTDIEKGFIRAEVIAYDDFIAYQGEAGAKEAGRWRLEGKDYSVHDGDIIHFRFNV